MDMASMMGGMGGGMGGGDFGGIDFSKLGGGDMGAMGNMGDMEDEGEDEQEGDAKTAEGEAHKPAGSKIEEIN